MQKFEILLNRGFSSTTLSDSTTAAVAQVVLPAPQPELFKSQQNLNFQQEYFMYLQQNGVSLVNNLNVKSYLNNPKNETVSREFINYLSATTSSQEFMDIVYDDSKLSDFFNDYYAKFFNYSNQGVGDTQIDSSIDLNDTKRRLTEQDKLYIKTNSQTRYIVQGSDTLGQPLSRQEEFLLLPTDTKNFSGQDESYYINVLIEQGRKTFFSDDFSQYYQDKCDGLITYNKYTYYNDTRSSKSYINISGLEKLEEKFSTNLGPSNSSINYLKSLLPSKYLSPQNPANVLPDNLYQGPTAEQLLSDQIQTSIFLNEYGYITVPVENSYNVDPLQNFRDFKQFSDFFGIDNIYKPWAPEISDSSKADENYIYQSKISFIDSINRLRAAKAGANEPPKLLSTYFQNVPEPYYEKFLGQEFDVRNINRYAIRIEHRKNQTESVIVKWEPASIATIGQRDGINSLVFENTNSVDPYQEYVNIDFLPNEPFKDVYLTIYPNWQAREPIVLSMRPFEQPNLILEYLVIYLEEFFEINETTSTDKIDVKGYDICNLMYNSFVYKNFNDNFFEFQRPDTIPVEFIGVTGITGQQIFDFNLTGQINSKLFDVFGQGSPTLSSLAQAIGAPQSGIYNIYVWGSYLFGTQREDSDINLIVIADSEVPAKKIISQDFNIVVYTPQRFQYELDQISVKLLYENSYSDSVFTVFASNNQKYRIQERIGFYIDNSKSRIKNASGNFKEAKWREVEKAFFLNNVDSWQKSLWAIFRNLVFANQIVKNGSITDLSEANSYLDDIKGRDFKDYVSLVNYYGPIIQNLYSTLLSL